MKLNVDSHGKKRRFIPPAGPRAPGSSRNLPLVRLAFWLVILAAIALGVLVLWGLATHEPSALPTSDL